MQFGYSNAPDHFVDNNFVISSVAKPTDWLTQWLIESAIWTIEVSYIGSTINQPTSWKPNICYYYETYTATVLLLYKVNPGIQIIDYRLVNWTNWTKNRTKIRNLIFIRNWKTTIANCIVYCVLYVVNIVWLAGPFYSFTISSINLFHSILRDQFVYWNWMDE